jgi:hypothetical protein
MADQPTTPSGSRWEPDPDAGPEADLDEGATAETPAAAESAPTYDVPPVVPLDDPGTEERRARLRGRAILAGAATALTLGGGLTGFVIGHSTAGDDTNRFQPTSFQGGGPGQQSEDGQQFGNGQPGTGQQGPPSFGDDGDGNGSQDGSSSSDDT